MQLNRGIDHLIAWGAIPGLSAATRDDNAGTCPPYDTLGRARAGNARGRRARENSIASRGGMLGIANRPHECTSQGAYK